MSSHKFYQKSVHRIKTAVLLMTFLTFLSGCAEDKSSASVEIDIPKSNSWDIYEIHNLDPDQTVPPRITFTHSDNMLYMAYYDHNPEFTEVNLANYPYKYRIRYKSLRLSNAAELSSEIIAWRHDYDPLRKIFIDQLEVYEKDYTKYLKALQEYQDALDTGIYDPFLFEPIPPLAPVKPPFDNDNGSISRRAVNETMTLLMDEGISMGDLSMAVSGTKPMIAYAVNDSAVYLPDYDLGNQGDVMIAVKDSNVVNLDENGNDLNVDVNANSLNWRKEIAAFGYCERNPVFRNGLAMSDFSLQADDNGNALLAFQFYYEGADSFNFTYPDLKFISQPVDGFVNASVDDVADLEETIEGSVFQLPSGQQKSAGDACDMVINNDGNPVTFFYVSNLNAGSETNTGLRTAVRINDTWQTEWIHNNIEIVQISAAVKPNGLLGLVYTIKDYQDYDYGNETDDLIPYSIRYAEQVEVVTGVDTDGNDITELEWKHESVNFVSIAGRYCSLAMDSDGNPVVAFFDEMNFTQTRFFSRVKIARKTPEGAWNAETIIPENVGLQVETSPYEIDPGQHDAYYIGKYNYLWLDRNDKIYLCTYSSIANRVYLFHER